MIMKDWMLNAAREIDEEPFEDAYGDNEIKTIILKHCPFKPDVAYMPVPRCDSCKHWASHTCACTAISIDAPKLPRGSLLLITTADFGCVRWEAK